MDGEFRRAERRVVEGLTAGGRTPLEVLAEPETGHAIGAATNLNCCATTNEEMIGAGNPLADDGVGLQREDEGLAAAIVGLGAAVLPLEGLGQESTKHSTGAVLDKEDSREDVLGLAVEGRQRYAIRHGREDLLPVAFSMPRGKMRCQGGQVGWLNDVRFGKKADIHSRCAERQVGQGLQVWVKVGQGQCQQGILGRWDGSQRI